jgi:hypothetical protein
VAHDLALDLLGLRDHPCVAAGTEELALQAQAHAVVGVGLHRQAPGAGAPAKRRLVGLGVHARRPEDAAQRRQRAERRVHVERPRGVQRARRRAPEAQREGRIGAARGRDRMASHPRVQHVLIERDGEGLDVVAAPGQEVRALDDDALDAADEVHVGIRDGDPHASGAV